MTTDRFKLVGAVYLVLRRGDEVLLLRRANTGYQDGNYSLVAGHMEGGELATHAIAREAREEADITVRPEAVRLVHTAHRLGTSISHERFDLFFEAKTWKGEVKNAEPEKCDDLSWHKLTDLPSNMVPLVREVLGKISNGEPYSEYSTEPV